MSNLNAFDKEESLLIIKELFAEMCSSRRQLKPILNEILRAIDNNIFIDADSEEVKELLEEILRMQDSLSQVDSLKKAVSTGKLAVIDEAISEIDRNQIVSELKLVLAKFKNLICDSDDENEIDAAKKLKRQAHKLSVKAEKINVESFAQEGSKFIDVAEKIENPSKISSTSFLEIQDNFPENKFLAYSIMKQSLHFDTKEVETKEDKHETVITNENQQSLPNETTIEKEIEAATEQTKEQSKLDSIKSLIEECAVSVKDVLIDESLITVEAKNIKKKISVKSLNNKIHELVDGSESFAFPVLRTFCKCRIFSTEPTFEDNQEDKSRLLIPVIVDKLYNWGIVDKVYWQELKFYYLNDQGQELLTRVLSIKNIKTSPRNSQENPKRRLIGYLRRFILFSTIWSLKIKNINNKLDTDTSRFWIRSIMRISHKAPHIFMSFSLLFLDENWAKTIENFLQAVEAEEEVGREIKGIFLVSSLSSEQITPWIRFFKEIGLDINIYAFLILNDSYKLIDEAGNEITPSEWSEMVSFGEVETDDSEDDEDFDYKDDDEEFNNPDDIDENEYDDSITDNVDDNNEFSNIDDNSGSISLFENAEEDVANVEEIDNKSDDLSIEDNEDVIVQKLLLKTTNFFIDGYAGRGMLLLHVLTSEQIFKNEDWAPNLSLEVGYILDDPLYSQQLRSIDPFDFWDNFFVMPGIDITEVSDYLNLAAIIKSFFAPPEPMSFQLKSRWNQLNDDKSNIALKTCPSAKKLINLFKTFAEQTHASFASCLNVDHSNVEDELKSAIDAVKAIRERTEAVSHMQLRHPRSQGLVKLLYEPKGEVRRLLDIEDSSLTEEDIIEFCNQFTEEDLKKLDTQGVTVTEDIFSESQIGDYLDEIWSSIKVDSRRNERFTSVERPRQINVLKQSLVAMLSYAFAKRRIESIKNSGKHKAPTTKALELLNDINKELDKLKQNISVKFIGSAIFGLFIHNLEAQINSKEKPLFYRDCLLGSKYLELNNEGIPIFNSYDVQTFSFADRVLDYNNALENLKIKEAVNAAYETAVRGCDLGILKLLEVHFHDILNRSDEELRRRRDNVSKQVERQLDRIYHEFIDNL